MRYVLFSLLVVILINGCSKDEPGSPPPTVVSYNPPSAEAGATVLITGTNFSTTAGDNTVSFNGTAATVTASTATTITTTVPVGATTGTVTVTVSEQTGTGPEFTVVPPPPTVVSYNPPSAEAGATVLITGTNFSTTAGDNTVSFNGTVAIVTASTATTITTTVPVGATTGTVTVTVSEQTGTGPEFTVVDPLAPTVVSYNPPSARAGATVLITGTNFSTTAGDNTVSFNGTTATVTASTATTITTTVPVGATTGTVTVTVDGKTATGPEFTVVDPLAPTVVSYNPPSAEAGATVLITGTNFSTTAGDNTVSFNGTAATVTASTATTITTTVPVGATTGTVTVTVDGKTGTGSEFTVVDPLAPTVVSYNPPSARAGATVLITGTNFSTTAGDNTVSFNGTAATVTASTATTITTTVPVGATTGTVTVTVDGKTATGPEFTVVVPPPPTVVSYNPPSARAGATVIITGTNFSTTAGNNTVSFNGTAATVTASTATTITTTVPVGATTGTVTVTVDGKTGTGSEFTVVVPPPPTVVSYNPPSARAEETVIITGTNFSTTAGDNTVSFNGIATTVTASTATTITTTVPVGKNTTGPVTVTVNGKTGTGPRFTVIVPTGPVDISISPLSYDYGEVSPSLGSPPRATFTVTNNEASRQAAITSIDITGTESALFAVSRTSQIGLIRGQPSGETVIQPRETVTISVEFIPPSTPGVSASATLTIQERKGTSLTVTLSAATPQTRIVYINRAVSGGDGSSWQNAFPSITQAFTALQRNNNLNIELWVAQGSYQAPPRGWGISAPRGLYGGFDGTETTREERDWVANRTILTGGNTSSHVLTIFPDTRFFDGITGETYDLVVDGFDITGGAALTRTNNDAIGGGLLIGNPLSRTSTTSVHVKINNVRIYGNKSAAESAAIYCSHLPTTITNAIITRNEGGADAGSDEEREITRLISIPRGSIINMNPVLSTAERYVKLINCTISGNTNGPKSELLTDARGIKHIRGNDQVRIYNTIMWGAAESIQSTGGSSEYVRNCIINMGSSYTGVNNNIVSDPLFLNAGSVENGLQTSSPAINAGNNSLFPSDIMTDINRNPRRNGTIDIGAIEDD